MDADGQVAHPGAGGVEDRVGHGRRHSDRTQLADALGADRAGVLVVVIDEVHVDIPDIGVARDDVAREVLRQEATEVRLERRTLEQGLAQAPR